MPGPNGSLPGAAERVPVGDGEAEVVLHRLAFDDLVLVVVAEGERVLALGAFEADLLDFGKCGHRVSYLQGREECSSFGEVVARPMRVARPEHGCDGRGTPHTARWTHNGQPVALDNHAGEARLNCRSIGTLPAMGSEDTSSAVQLDTLLVRTPGVCGRRLRVAGTRVTVNQIVTQYKRGETPEEVVQHFPHVLLGQIYAALAYYHSNQSQVEKELADEQLNGQIAVSRRARGFAT